MMTDSTDREQLIARYLNGDPAPDDEEELIRWIRESPGNKKLFFRIKDTWDASRKPMKTEAEQLLLFYRKLALRGTGKTFPRFFRAAVAAVLILGLLAGGFLFYHREPVVESQV